MQLNYFKLQCFNYETRTACCMGRWYLYCGGKYHHSVTNIVRKLSHKNVLYIWEASKYRINNMEATSSYYVQGANNITLRRIKSYTHYIYTATRFGRCMWPSSSSNLKRVQEFFLWRGLPFTKLFYMFCMTTWQWPHRLVETCHSLYIKSVYGILLLRVVLFAFYTQ